MIKVLYFASIRERLDCSEEDIELSPQNNTIAGLKTTLSERGAIWSDVFDEDKQLFSSVNQVIAKNKQRIEDNDEVAFFPQVTGG